MLKRIMFIFIIATVTALISMMLNRAYIVVGLSSYSWGCKEAALRLGKDYGPAYKTYMDNFCAARYEMFKKEFTEEN